MFKRFLSFWQKIKHRLLLFFTIFGPGIITAVADNDAGGVATYSVAASLYGMAAGFLIIPQTILLGFTQEIGARIAMVTKKGLGDLIRERYGVVISVIIFILYFITNQGVVLQNVSGLKSSLQLFHLPWQISLIIICSLLIIIVVSFNYKQLQKIFLFLIFFYFSYILSAILAKPNWGQAIQESLIWPQTIKITDLKFWFSRIAVLGTTVTAWGQFFVHSYIIDKKLDTRHIKMERLEIYLGALFSNFIAWMMMVAVTYTLFVNHIIVGDGYSAALAMTPLVGDLATILFSLGLFAASILGLTIVPLATAYVFSEMFGYEGSLDADFKKGKLFYSFFIIQILLALIIALFPNTSLFKLTLYADFLNGAMLPIIFFFLVKFAGNKEIMGQYHLTGLSKFGLNLAALIISLMVVVALVGKLIGII